MAADTSKYTDVNNGYKPGRYIVKVTGTITGTQMQTAPTLTVDFIFQVNEVCDPPASLTASTLTNFNYLIGVDGLVTKTFDPFTVSPSFCPITYTSTINPLQIGSWETGFVSTPPRTFTIDFSASTNPVG